eukprot:Ihof_evm8s61 gene=Ihof_evmTU8s61
MPATRKSRRTKAKAAAAEAPEEVPVASPVEETETSTAPEEVPVSEATPEVSGDNVAIEEVAAAVPEKEEIEEVPQKEEVEEVPQKEEVQGEVQEEVKEKTETSEVPTENMDTSAPVVVETTEEVKDETPVSMDTDVSANKVEVEEKVEEQSKEEAVAGSTETEEIKGEESIKEVVEQTDKEAEQRAVVQEIVKKEEKRKEAKKEEERALDDPLPVDKEPTPEEQVEIDAAIAAFKGKFDKRLGLVLVDLPESTEEEIKELLQEYGTIGHIDLATKEGLTTARVKFENGDQACAARTGLATKQFKEKPVTVKPFPMDNVVFIGSLPLDLSEVDFTDLCKSVVQPEWVFLVHSMITGKFKGYGLAEFATADQANQARFKIKGRIVGGRPARVEKVFSCMDDVEKTQSRTLFVDKLPNDFKDTAHLRQLFTHCGIIQFCQISLFPQGYSRGFAMIDYETWQEADKAQKLFNNYRLHGHNMRVGFGNPTKIASLTMGQPVSMPFPMGVRGPAGMLPMRPGFMMGGMGPRPGWNPMMMMGRGGPMRGPHEGMLPDPIRGHGPRGPPYGMPGYGPRGPHGGRMPGAPLLSGPPGRAVTPPMGAAQGLIGSGQIMRPGMPQGGPRPDMAAGPRPVYGGAAPGAALPGRGLLTNPTAQSIPTPAGSTATPVPKADEAEAAAPPGMGSIHPSRLAAMGVAGATAVSSSYNQRPAPSSGAASQYRAPAEQGTRAPFNQHQSQYSQQQGGQYNQQPQQQQAQFGGYGQGQAASNGPYKAPAQAPYGGYAQPQPNAQPPAASGTYGTYGVYGDQAKAQQQTQAAAYAQPQAQAAAQPQSTTQTNATATTAQQKAYQQQYHTYAQQYFQYYGQWPAGYTPPTGTAPAVAAPVATQSAAPVSYAQGAQAASAIPTAAAAPVGAAAYSQYYNQYSQQAAAATTATPTTTDTAQTGDAAAWQTYYAQLAAYQKQQQQAAAGSQAYPQPQAGAQAPYTAGYGAQAAGQPQGYPQSAVPQQYGAPGQAAGYPGVQQP